MLVFGREGVRSGGARGFGRSSEQSGLVVGHVMLVRAGFLLNNPTQRDR